MVVTSWKPRVTVDLEEGSMEDGQKISMLADDIRPNRFGQMVGNKEPLGRLTSLIGKNLFPPAIFLPGPTGCGKTTLGRIVARAKLCRGRKPGELAMSSRKGARAGGEKGATWVQE